MLIDGKLLAEKILVSLSKRVQTLEESLHIQPHLGVIIVGNDLATASYVKQKKRMGEQIGGVVSVYQYPETIPQKELEKSIDFLQESGELDGLIIQLPLPKNLDTESLTNRVEKEKDVDGFRNDSSFHEPIAIAAVKILEEIFSLEHEKKKIAAKEFLEWLKMQKIVVLGKGKTGGKPILALFEEMGLHPVIVDSKTANPGEITKEADILVCAVGNKGTIINEAMIKKDVILLGIGMHRGADGKLHGDYEIEDIKDKASYYTPIPGGVGPVNAAMLLSNVIDAAEKNRQL